MMPPFSSVMTTYLPWPTLHFDRSRGVRSSANLVPSRPLISTCRSTLTSHSVTWLIRCQYSSNGSVYRPGRYM